MRLVPRSGIERKWLAQALNAPSVREQMSLVATGTSDSMRNISQEKVRRLELRVPPLKEQLRIVDEIEQQLSRIEAVRAASAHALIRSDHLRRAILERAFSGQLVSQDPNDEAATGLSARIPAQGTTATRPRRRMRG
jgi:type I restriction enzyme S subunit